MTGIYLVITVAALMEIHFIQMATLIALYVKPVPLGMRKLFTINKCLPMYNSKDQPYGCKNEESQKRQTKNIKSSETENFYASIISQATEYFREQR